MRNFNFEAVFVDEETSLELDRIVINYDPKLRVGDIFKSYIGKPYTIKSSQKFIDTEKDKIYYVYYVNDNIDSISSTVLSFLD